MPLENGVGFCMLGSKRSGPSAFEATAPEPGGGGIPNDSLWALFSAPFTGWASGQPGGAGLVTPQRVWSCAWPFW